jgi:hypothetical protein
VGSGADESVVEVDNETDERGGTVDEDRDESLLVDGLLSRLDAFRVLRAKDEDEASAALEALGVDGAVEVEMVAELSARSVLAHPERFVTAHVAVMKALEVLDRNRSRQPALRLGGPLRPLAAGLVAQLARMQLEGYERKVLNNLGSLYRRREAQTVEDTVEHRRLRRARKQVDRIREGVAGGGAALTTLLLSGAALSVVGTGVSSVLETINAHWWALLVATVAFVAVALAACWVILQSAAVARRRIRITLDEPLDALYETVGDAGQPPQDPTRQFAFFSLLALTIGWIVVPVAIGVVLWPD